MATRLTGRARRKRRIRKKVSGTKQRPRLTVFRSHKQIYAQVIDDLEGKTLAAVSSLGAQKPAAGAEPGPGTQPDTETKTEAKPKTRSRAETAKRQVAGAVGAAIAAACKEKGIVKVIFDRSGYLYHGRVKALAEAARKGGLQF